MPIQLKASFADRTVLSGPTEQRTATHYVEERTGRTDAAGRFAFADLAPGEYTLAPGHQGFALNDGERILIDRSGRTRDIEIVFEATLSMRGQVVDPSGEPVSNVAVSVFAEMPTPPGGGQVFTGLDGRFEVLGLSRGSYRVIVYPIRDTAKGDRRLLRQRVLTHVDPLAGDLVVELEAGVPIIGSVVDSSGAGVSGVAVRALDAEGREVARGTSDELGQFDLLLEPGITVDLEAAPNVRASGDVEPGPAPAVARVETVRAGMTGVRIELPAGAE